MFLLFSPAKKVCIRSGRVTSSSESSRLKGGTSSSSEFSDAVDSSCSSCSGSILVIGIDSINKKMCQ